MSNGVIITLIFFPLKSGVRQGGVLSPILFSIFIDGLVDKLSSLGLGCHIANACVAIFLYADDIVLLSPTVTGLQALFSICEAELTNLNMQINAGKTVCIRFGQAFKKSCRCLLTCNKVALQWSTSSRYLGVYFVSGYNLKCSFDVAKSKYFKAFNAIFGKIGSLASETVILHLIKSKCLPVLLYGTESLQLKSHDLHSINFTVTRTLMKLFRTCSVDTVNECLKYCRVLPVQYSIELRTANFYKCLVCTKTAYVGFFRQFPLRGLTKFIASITPECAL